MGEWRGRLCIFAVVRRGGRRRAWMGLETMRVRAQQQKTLSCIVGLWTEELLWMEQKS